MTDQHRVSKNTFESLIANFPGTPGIVVKTLGQEQCFRFNAELLFPAASLIKLPILWEFFYQCATGRIDPTEEIELRDEDIAIGFGVLRQLKPGLKLRLHDLAVLMTVISDNTAANLLIDRLGMENINTSIQNLGLMHTKLQHKLHDSSDLNQDNFTTPTDMARMLESFVQQQSLLGEYKHEPLKLLEGQHCKNKLHLGVPKGTRLANKTGEALWLEHDVGVLFGQREAAVIVVMTTGLVENYQGIELCREVARLVYQELL
ncbi:serine hydrolase [Pseudanabaenaceae cyanobacterium LEGE 13415]|nr:serine hydrolase [Pseudanabaenaceae cyanobacterium LEGE 13415]